MPSYLITGAGRGLGYAILKNLAPDPSNTVIGLVRNQKAAEDRLAKDNISAHLVTADIIDEGALTLAAEEAQKILGDRGLDVLINNAALVGGSDSLKSLKDFESDAQHAVADIQLNFEINTLGTLKAIYAFLPLIKRGQQKKVISISSGMADLNLINDYLIDPAQGYASSKAALNVIIAKLNAAYKDQGILFTSICPGEVDTTADGAHPAPSEDDLGRFQSLHEKFDKYSPGNVAFTPEAAAKNVLTAVERSSLENGNGGGFLSHNGTQRWM